jgi:hypothetical protein
MRCRPVWGEVRCRTISTTARHGIVAGRMPRKLFDRQNDAIYRARGLTDGQRRRIIA